jgi:hypothetical protein
MRTPPTQLSVFLENANDDYSTPVLTILLIVFSACFLLLTSTARAKFICIHRVQLVPTNKDVYPFH